MKIYELLILDAEDVRDFAYHAERLFFSSVEQAESYQKQHFQNPNLFGRLRNTRWILTESLRPLPGTGLGPDWFNTTGQKPKPFQGLRARPRPAANPLILAVSFF
jgi:hypothetical protein